MGNVDSALYSRYALLEICIWRSLLEGCCRCFLLFLISSVFATVAFHVALAPCFSGSFALVCMLVMFFSHSATVSPIIRSPCPNSDKNKRAKPACAAGHTTKRNCALLRLALPPLPTFELMAQAFDSTVLCADRAANRNGAICRLGGRRADSTRPQACRPITLRRVNQFCVC